MVPPQALKMVPGTISEMVPGTISSRRGFLAALPAMVLVPGFAAAADRRGFVLPNDGGEVVLYGSRRSPVRIKVDSAKDAATSLSMITQDIAPGEGVPVHLHEREDEICLVRSGEGIATLGDERVPVKAGTTIFVPRGTWHGVENTGAAVIEWVGIYSPAGFEGYFREIAKPVVRTAAEREALDRRFGIRYRR